MHRYLGEERALACAPLTVRRAKDTLTVRLGNGRILTFVDKPPGEFESGTMFRGTITSVPLYITSSYGGERLTIYSIINRRDRAELTFEELPLFSPDSMRFAVTRRVGTTASWEVGRYSRMADDRWTSGP